MVAAIIIGVFIISVLYAHSRGVEKQKFSRQLFDHSTFMAPINMFMTGLSRLPAKQPYFPVEDFPELRQLTDNWQVIRDEAIRLQDHIKAAQTHNDAGFNTFFKRGWKRFYLKWYSDAHPSARELCPVTTELVSNIPGVKAAMFAELPPGSHLGKHRDPYAGSVRYHLGLQTPNDDRCFIEVDRQRHSWRDGQAVIFDETYVHWAQNESGIAQRRKRSYRLPQPHLQIRICAARCRSKPEETQSPVVLLGQTWTDCGDFRANHRAQRVLLILSCRLKRRFNSQLTAVSLCFSC